MFKSRQTRSGSSRNSKNSSAAGPAGGAYDAPPDPLVGREHPLPRPFSLRVCPSTQEQKSAPMCCTVLHSASRNERLSSEAKILHFIDAPLPTTYSGGARGNDGFTRPCPPAPPTTVYNTRLTYTVFSRLHHCSIVCRILPLSSLITSFSAIGNSQKTAISGTGLQCKIYPSY